MKDLPCSISEPFIRLFSSDRMEVLLLTILVSLLLTTGFVIFFVYLQRNPESDPERDSLLPLEEEQSIIAADGKPVARQTQATSKPTST